MRALLADENFVFVFHRTYKQCVYTIPTMKQGQKSIIITGGAGFIGSHCADLFLASGFEVGVFDIKPQSEAVNLGHVLDRITYIEGDIRDFDQLSSAVSGYDYVLHLAAIVSVQESMHDPVLTHETNVTGTLNVFEAARKQGGKRVVYASSAAVYGDTTVVPTPEDTPQQPLSPYGLHKVINESYGSLYGAQFGLSNIGLRFFNVYGSRQDASSPYSGVISIFAKYMQAGKTPTIYGDGSATRDFVHVADVAAACRAAMEIETADTFVCNIGSEKTVAVREIVDTLNEILSTDIKPQHQEARPGDIQHSCGVCSVARERLSYRPSVSLEQGLREVIGNT